VSPLDGETAEPLGSALAAASPEVGDDALDIDVAVVEPDETASAGDGEPLDIPVPAEAAGAPAADAPLEFEVETDDLVEAGLPPAEMQTIEGADVLDAIADDAAPPPRSLDFEPLVGTAPAASAAPPPAPAAEVAAPAPAPAPAPAARIVAPAPVRAAVAPPPPPVPSLAAPPPPPVAPPREPSPPCVVSGSHRVVVHTVEGTVKRGVLKDADLAASTLALASQGGAPGQEDVGTDKVKAIFFMLSPGEKAPAAAGKKVRVTFRDGRQVAGFSPDYSEAGAGFFMIPGDTRTNTGRIWVYRAAVRQVAVS
jgi:hypothetical protein